MNPDRARTSASHEVWHATPVQLPAASCWRISAVHLWALKCGRRAARWPEKNAAPRRMFRPAAPASTTRHGVGS
ncbi:MAG TPA: hypothetical protein VN870_01615 [Streptosporangiaceae bacterium]|nr:hypothetical protein [Streptosporangiaceae bacterium]